MNAWQDITALACVALAGTYILWRVARKLVKRSGSGCGGCSNCGTSEGTGTPKQLISLAPPQGNKPGDSRPDAASSRLSDDESHFF